MYNNHLFFDLFCGRTTILQIDNNILLLLLLLLLLQKQYKEKGEVTHHYCHRQYHCHRCVALPSIRVLEEQGEEEEKEGEPRGKIIE